MKPLAIFTGMVVLVAGSVLGHPHPRSPVEMELLVNGRSIGGSSGGTVVVPVRRLGCEYVLRIRNHSPVAMEAVVSVDGLSVINGRRASQSIRGYLIQPNATVEIPGWRRGNRKVAAFKFSREEDSYAYRTGRPDGIGVIRLTAYEEARKAYRAGNKSDSRAKTQFAESERREWAKTSSAGNAPRGRYAVLEPDRIGTGYGRELDHHVSRVPFQRGHRIHRLTIHYGSFERHAPADDDFTPPPAVR